MYLPGKRHSQEDGIEIGEVVAGNHERPLCRYMLEASHLETEEEAANGSQAAMSQAICQCADLTLKSHSGHASAAFNLAAFLSLSTSAHTFSTTCSTVSTVVSISTASGALVRGASERPES